MKNNSKIEGWMLGLWLVTFFSISFFNWSEEEVKDPGEFELTKDQGFRIPQGEEK